VSNLPPPLTPTAIAQTEVGANVSLRAPSGFALKPARSKGRLTIDAVAALRERRSKLQPLAQAGTMIRRGPSRAAIPLRQFAQECRKRGGATRRDDFVLRDP
jgi:hypothetical protein